MQTNSSRLVTIEEGLPYIGLVTMMVEEQDDELQVIYVGMNREEFTTLYDEMTKTKQTMGW